MWKLAIAGLALTVTGAVKFTDHLAALGRQAMLMDYLALRCGSDGVQAASGGHGLYAQALLHCWGCYAMVAGAALLGLALWQAAAPRQKRLKLRR